MGDKSTDGELVARVQQGEKSAFNLLVQKYQHRVIKLVSRYVRNPADAQDVAQDVFIRAYRALASFRGDSAFYTWIYRIAINTSKNFLAADARRPHDIDATFDDDGERFEIEEQQASLDTPERLLLTDEIQRTVLDAIDKLPDDLRAALTLRELDGLSYEEIANVMDCPIGTVRSRIFRAREAVDARLRPLLEN